MAFRMSDALSRTLEGWGISHTKANAEAERLAALYPDAAQFEAKFSEWVAANAEAELNLSALSATLIGIGRDIFSGVAGKDKKAHQGNV